MRSSICRRSADSVAASKRVLDLVQAAADVQRASAYVVKWHGAAPSGISEGRF
jgi:hypothetical protein